ncbi:MAG: amino acid ABC transporter substrate-binding protein [Erysipelotrichaceae bacterium]
MKKLALYLFVLILMVGCTSTNNTDTSLKTIKDKGVLVVGYTEFPPMGFTENGVATGFDVDLAREVASRMGVDVTFQYIDWDAKVLELANNVDVIWNGLTITPERKLEMTFSKPYLNNRIVILTLADSTINSLADLADKKVGVELDSSGQIAVVDNASVAGSITELVKYSNYVEAVLDLNAGGIDAVVVDEIFARYAMSQKSGAYRIANEVFNSENYGLGFRLGDIKLQTEVDKILDEMIADGTAATISVKWFGEDIIVRE